MNFEARKFEEENNEKPPVWETPEALEKKIEEYTGIIMSQEEVDDVGKMGIAAKIAETFSTEDGQRLMDKVAEEIEKSKGNKGRMGHMKKIEDEWRKGLDKAA